MRFIMRTFYVGIALLALASAANATTVSEREYKRGYNDCMAGRYDQNQHGASYKAGCRAAEDAMKSGSTSSGGSANTVDVAGVKVPRKALDSCISDAASAMSVRAQDIKVIKVGQEGSDNYYIEVAGPKKHLVCSVNSQGQIFDTRYGRL